MAFSFNRFSDASKADTPQYAAAAARQAQLENQAEMQANALRQQEMTQGVGLYKAIDGEEGNIGNTIGDWMNTPAAEQSAEMGLEGNIYGDAAAEAEMGSSIAPLQEGLGLEAAATDAGVLGDLTAAADAAELAGTAETIAGVGEVAGAAELAGTAEAALGTAELAGLGGAAAAEGGLMSALGSANPYIAAALAAYELFS
jgi:hypothetical protein